MTICFCGTEDSYPHHPYCPYPLFRASDAHAAKCQAEYDRRVRTDQAARSAPADSESVVSGVAEAGGEPTMPTA